MAVKCNTSDIFSDFNNIDTQTYKKKFFSLLEEAAFKTAVSNERSNTSGLPDAESTEGQLYSRLLTMKAERDTAIANYNDNKNKPVAKKARLVSIEEKILGPSIPTISTIEGSEFELGSNLDCNNTDTTENISNISNISESKKKNHQKSSKVIDLDKDDDEIKELVETYKLKQQLDLEKMKLERDKFEFEKLKYEESKEEGKRQKLKDDAIIGWFMQQSKDNK